MAGGWDQTCKWFPGLPTEFCSACGLWDCAPVSQAGSSGTKGAQTSVCQPQEPSRPRPISPLAGSCPRDQLLLTSNHPHSLPPQCCHSQHQVAALQFCAIQGPTREVPLFRGFLPVLERCLRWGLEHLVLVCGQLLMKDTFLSKHTGSGWDA